MKNSQHVGFWLLLAALGFFASPLLRSAAAMERQLKLEIEQTRTVLGEQLTRHALAFADGVFERTPLAVLAAGFSAARHTPEQQRLSAQVSGPGGLAASTLYNAYLHGVILQAYAVALRIVIVLFWLVALGPFLLASVIDGLMRRNIKQAEFGSLRPATFTLAGLLAIPLCALPVLYLTIPFGASPLLAPLWAAGLALPLSLLVSHSQPLFSR